MKRPVCKKRKTISGGKMGGKYEMKVLTHIPKQNKNSLVDVESSASG